MQAQVKAHKRVRKNGVSVVRKHVRRVPTPHDSPSKQMQNIVSRHVNNLTVLANHKDLQASHPPKDMQSKAERSEVILSNIYHKLPEGHKKFFQYKYPHIF